MRFSMTSEMSEIGIQAANASIGGIVAARARLGGFHRGNADKDVRTRP
jgi:hypothetical protein